MMLNKIMAFCWLILVKSTIHFKELSDFYFCPRDKPVRFLKPAIPINISCYLR